MAIHSRSLIRDMLRSASVSVAEGEQRLRTLEALVMQQDLKGRRSAESVRLLRNMRETQSLMQQHVRLLVSELEVDGDADAGSS
jgi:hypothetical protein